LRSSCSAASRSPPSRDYAKRGRALEPPPQFAAQDEQSERLNLRAEPEYFQELLEVTRRSNGLARSMDLPDCIVPLPEPGGEAPSPA
jgi:hypothetical protein